MCESILGVNCTVSSWDTTTVALQICPNIHHDMSTQIVFVFFISLSTFFLLTQIVDIDNSNDIGYRHIVHRKNIGVIIMMFMA